MYICCTSVLSMLVLAVKLNCWGAMPYQSTVFQRSAKSKGSGGLCPWWWSTINNVEGGIRWLGGSCSITRSVKAVFLFCVYRAYTVRSVSALCWYPLLKQVFHHLLCLYGDLLVWTFTLQSIIPPASCRKIGGYCQVKNKESKAHMYTLQYTHAVL